LARATDEDHLPDEVVHHGSLDVPHLAILHSSKDQSRLFFAVTRNSQTVTAEVEVFAVVVAPRAERAFLGRRERGVGERFTLLGIERGEDRPALRELPEGEQGDLVSQAGAAKIAIEPQR